ncbi:hypothetical protein KR038_008265 [Drosophila bunnanda]|nr:hypothetical protein KR038_008265 [Drosophila bunnanda]
MTYFHYLYSYHSQIIFCLLLGLNCSSGFVHNRHEIEKRDANGSSKEWRFPADFIKTILAPIANLADKIEVNIPGLASYRTENNND